MEEYKKQTISAYDGDPKYYTGKFSEQMKEYVTPILERFVSELKGPTVLDIGCGPGLHLEFFRAQGLDALGIDLSESFLEICATKGLNVRRMDMEDPLLYPYSFDGIWANAAMLHVPRERIPPMIVKWTKLLRQNGLLHVAVKKGSGDEYQPAKNNAERKRYYTYFSEEELKELFAARFEVIQGCVYTTESGDTWIDYLFRLKPEKNMAYRNF